MFEALTLSCYWGVTAPRLSGRKVRFKYTALYTQVVLLVKNPPANSGDVRGTGSIPPLGRSPGAGHSDPLRYSCLENAMDRGAWRVIVHGVAKNQTRLKRVSMHTYRHTHPNAHTSPWLHRDG